MSRAFSILGSLLVVLAFLVLVLCPWSYFFSGEVSLASMLASPSWQHPLGADNLGRDLLVRFSASIYQSTLPLWGVSIGGTTLGWIVGLGTIVKVGSQSRPVWLLRAVCTGLVGIPISVVAFTWAVWNEGAGYGPILVSLATVFACRAFLQIVELYEHDERLGFWQVHEAIGGSMGDRLWRYGVCQGWYGEIAASLAFNLKIAIAIEAALSYLGFGIQEPNASFGNMLASHLNLYLKGQWYVPAVIVAAFMLTVMVPESLVRLFIPQSRSRLRLATEA